MSAPAAAKNSKVSVQAKVVKLPSEELGLSNKVYLSPQDAATLKSGVGSAGDFVQVKEFVFTFEAHPKIAPGCMGFNAVQRRFLLFSFNDPLEAIAFNPQLDTIYLSAVTFEVDFMNKSKKSTEEFPTGEIEKILRREFFNQFFTINQKLVADCLSNNLEFRVAKVDVVDIKRILALNEKDLPPPVKQDKASDRGILHQNTLMSFVKAPGSTIQLLGSEGEERTGILKVGFNFEQMGVGGLGREFSDIFRRAFASRVFPISIIEKLGIQHVKGILLYGPPGTGKTLMARQIGKMLNGKEPKIVNGPEILNKYVGQSEENVRNLFKEAEAEYAEKKERSDLHVIIFDEIDAICKQRGSRNDGTGVGDTVVNQLLAKIDGVNSLNNILLIGMTNRKDLIDEALLRPGRLEVHMEISLPDEVGRLEILRIHTKKMRDSKSMGADVDLAELATNTKNFSGAEIEGLVKSATSFALNRKIDAKDGIKLKDGEIVVTRADFHAALEECKPNITFGLDEDQFANCMRNGIINYGAAVRRLLSTGATLIEQVRNSSRTPLISVLLEGSAGAGKTALAAKLASDTGYPYVKLISPELLVGYSENGKCTKITKIFEDSYKSPLSCIVVDDIERLLDYVRIGPRFSNVVLQLLLVCFKKEPPKGRKLLIIGTTSNRRVLEDMECLDLFDSILKVPQISTPDEFKSVLSELGVFSGADLNSAAAVFAPISVKKLIMKAEMAVQGSGGSVLERFLQSMQDL